MTKRVLIVVLFITLYCLQGAHAQSYQPDRQWRAFKLGFNNHIELPFLNGFEDALRRSPGTSGILPGIFSPALAWGKGQNRWWEVSLQMLETSTNTDFEETFNDSKIPGRLNVHFYAGTSLERVYRSKINLGKILVFWSFGMLPQYGKLAFRSKDAAVLDWKADHWRLDYFFGPRILFLDRKYFFMDFQTYAFGGFSYTNTIYENVNGSSPADKVSKISEVSFIWPFLQFRFSAGYRF